jgi:hypothetical protein
MICHWLVVDFPRNTVSQSLPSERGHNLSVLEIIQSIRRNSICMKLDSNKDQFNVNTALISLHANKLTSLLTKVKLPIEIVILSLWYI